MFASTPVAWIGACVPTLPLRTISMTASMPPAAQMAWQPFWKPAERARNALAASPAASPPLRTISTSASIPPCLMIASLLAWLPVARSRNTAAASPLVSGVPLRSRETRGAMPPASRTASRWVRASFASASTNVRITASAGVGVALSGTPELGLSEAASPPFSIGGDRSSLEACSEAEPAATSGPLVMTCGAVGRLRQAGVPQHCPNRGRKIAIFIRRCEPSQSVCRWTPTVKRP